MRTDFNDREMPHVVLTSVNALKNVFIGLKKVGGGDVSIDTVVATTCPQLGFLQLP